MYDNSEFYLETKLKRTVCLLSGRNILILLSGLQVQLYEDFAKSRAKCDIDETVSSISLNEETEKPKLKSTGHVFQVQIFSVIFIT